MKTEETPICEIDSNLLSTFESYTYLKDFDCRLDVVSDYYKGNLKRALKSENVKGIGAISQSGVVVGFCTLTLAHIDRDLARKGIKEPNQTPQIPVVRMVMFGVDKDFQGFGIGQQILRDALKQAVKVHAQVPIKGLYLDAAPNAVTFYESLGFKKLDEPDANNSTPMWIGIKVMLQAVNAIPD